jgi:carboxymethylenebutenolidase
MTDTGATGHGISAGDVTLETADGPMRLYEARPPGEARGALVVVQEAFGVNPHIEDVTRRAAAAGYHAVAPDFFHRSGPGAIVEYGKFDLVMEYFQALGSDDSILVDVDAALAHLHAAGFDDSRTGIVGFCFGGRVSFLVALRRALGASVGFYGGGIVRGRIPQFPALVGEVEALRTPWLGLFGDHDGSIPVDDVEQLRAALQGAKVDTDIVRYPDAGHGFHCDRRPEYRAEDAADAWRRALDWFSAHLA